jgi:hypothetical protein
VPWGQALTQPHKPFPGALRVLQLPNVLWAYIAVLMAGSLGRSTAAAAHKRADVAESPVDWEIAPHPSTAPTHVARRFALTSARASNTSWLIDPVGV